MKKQQPNNNPEVKQQFSDFGIQWGIINAEVTFLSPYLMDSPASMLLDPRLALGIKAKRGMDTKERNPEVECERAAYRMKDNMLYMPSTHIKGCMIHAAAAHKPEGKGKGRQSAKSLIAGCVRVEPEKISLGVKEYKQNALTAVNWNTNPPSRVVKYRPEIPVGTKARFQIKYRTDLLTERIIHLILEDGGTRYGVGSYRPQNEGQYGTFTVTKWEQA